MAKNKNISPKGNSNIKEFRPKIRIYLPVVRCDVAMVTALIQKIGNQKIIFILLVPMLVNLYRDNFTEKLIRIPFLTRALY